MKILEREFHAHEILNVLKGIHPMADFVCQDRRSDAFVYIVSGCGTYFFGKNAEKVTGGNVMFLARHSSYHFTILSPNFHYIVIDFFFEESEKIPLENQVFRGAQLASLESVFLKMHALWFKGSFADRLSCKSLLYRVYSSAADSAIQSYLSRVTRERVQAAMQKLQESYCDPNFSVEELSKLCGVTPVHFRRIFRQIHHTTPMKYLISMRISKARELLGATHLSIAEIAEACGFHTAYYFAKKFHEVTDMSPSEYRKYIHNH